MPKEITHWTPDTPFFYLAGPKKAIVQQLSAPFHGTDARALAASVICHILADTGFHPLVFCFSGMDGIHPGATARHRQFETAMDTRHNNRAGLSVVTFIHDTD